MSEPEHKWMFLASRMTFSGEKSYVGHTSKKNNLVILNASIHIGAVT